MEKAVKVHSILQSFLVTADAYIHGNINCTPLDVPDLLQRYVALVLRWGWGDIIVRII